MLPPLPLQRRPARWRGGRRHRKPPAHHRRSDHHVRPQEQPAPYHTLAAKTWTRRDGLTDAGLAHFQAAYRNEKITNEDLFYYVYAVLHAAEYRKRHADDLGKERPRMPCAPTAADFWAFSKAGRALGELHVGNEKEPECAARVEGAAKPTAAHLHVEKMKFGKVRAK